MAGDILIQTLWTAVSVSIATFMGWALGAAGPAFGILLALGTGYAIFRVCFEEDWHLHDDDEEDYDDSGASDEARDYWKDHSEGKEL